MTTTVPAATESRSAAARTIEIELLALDLDTCTRCVGTLSNIEQAIAAVRQVTEHTGTTIRVRKVVIASEEEACRHRFVSSPTIRVDGRDIVLETLESTCESCTDLCGCTEGTSCRVWRYQGEEHTEAPVGLVVEALLREIAGPVAVGAAAGEAPAYELPANLRSFFAGKASRAAVTASACCAPSEQATCCEPAEKAVCCGGPEPAACGCR
jgi:hypothetical protein